MIHKLPEPLLLPKAVAADLGMSESWLSKSRITGSGPKFIKIGGSVRYQQSAVDAYKASRQRSSTSEVAA